MRRFLSLAFACLVAFPGVLPAQQLNIAVGGSTLYSFKPTTASLAFPPPAEKGGVYPDASVEYLFANRLGFSVEGAYRYKTGLYNDFQTFRPVLYDLNAVWAPRITPKITGDFMAGVGGQTLIFYDEFAPCAFSGCTLHLNSTHFAIHAAAELRYYVWRNFFVRPEAHYYIVPNNYQFHSDHVFRIGASIGHTWGDR